MYVLLEFIVEVANMCKSQFCMHIHVTDSGPVTMGRLLLMSPASFHQDINFILSTILVQIRTL